MSEDRAMGPNDRHISAALKRELEREVDDLDAVTRSKLSAARHRAIAVSEGRWLHIGTLIKPWTIGAGLAAMALLTIIIIPSIAPPLHTQREQPQLTSTAPVLEDLSILAASDGVDFYQSVDFLLWLESNTGSEG